MVSFKMNVKVSDFGDKINKQIDRKLKEGMQDVVSDLARVAAAAAPHASGYLEGHKSFKVSKGGGTLTGTVGFSAMNNGFNYAKWTHDKTYKLGKKSAKKSGGKSRFGGQTVPVGTGYLSNALEYSEAGYKQHLADKYREALR